MSVAAILGAGDLGGAIAHKLALRASVRVVRLIDDNVNIAAGKALDIQQSGSLTRSHVRLEGTADVLAASGAAVIVVADEVGQGEWSGERGVALVRQLVRSGTEAAFVFAGPAQTSLMEAAARELGVAADRVVGTAPSALIGVVRSLVGVELNGSGVDVHVTVAGRPPSFVIAWSSATVGGSLVSDRVPAHRLLAIAQLMRGLWPPGPQAIAAATARVVDGLVRGSRQVLHALTILDGELGVRHVAAMLPLELGRGRVLARRVPGLSPQERVDLINGL